MARVSRMSFPAFSAGLGPEVGEEAALHPDGLSHVEDFVLGAQHPVDAGPVLGVVADVGSEAGIEDH